MADSPLTDVQVKIREVLMPVVENYLKTQNALITAGIAVDITDQIAWGSLGGKHVTRVQFKGGLQAKRLDPVNGTDAQNVSYTEEKYPLISSIIPFQYEGTTIQDLFDNKGFFNRLSEHLHYVINDDLDKTLIDYTANIGDGSKQYGALGTALSHDITGATVKTLTYDHLVDARAKFGDSPGPLTLLCHSKVMTDLIKTTEAKNLQQGIMIGNSVGIFFPTLGMYALMSDRLPVTAGTPNTYTSLLCKPACMGYGWKLPLDVQNAYMAGKYKFQLDFVWRFAMMRNFELNKDKIVKLVSQ